MSPRAGPAVGGGVGCALGVGVGAAGVGAGALAQRAAPLSTHLARPPALAIQSAGRALVVG